MKVQAVKRRMRIQEWTAQVKSCTQSGLTVRQWCEENGVNVKTYYNHLKIVREEIMETLESNPKTMHITTTKPELTTPHKKPEQNPIFAPLPLPNSGTAAITVRIGGYSIEIQAGTDVEMITQVLQIVSRL